MNQKLPTGYRIRHCTKESDAKYIHEFVVELAQCAGKGEFVETTPETFLRDGLQTSNPLFKAAFAEYFDNNIWIPVGFALWFHRFNSCKGRTADLDDFVNKMSCVPEVYIREAHRAKGLGTALFKLCVKEVHQSGCANLEWIVLKYNDRAKKMYLSLGAEYPEGGIWEPMRLSLDAMKKLTNSSSED